MGENKLILKDNLLIIKNNNKLNIMLISLFFYIVIGVITYIYGYKVIYSLGESVFITFLMGTIAMVLLLITLFLNERIVIIEITKVNEKYLNDINDILEGYHFSKYIDNSNLYYQRNLILYHGSIEMTISDQSMYIKTINTLASTITRFLDEENVNYNFLDN